MAKSKKTAAPAKKQTTEASAPKPAAPTTNPVNDPTVVPPVTDKNVADPNVDDSEIVDTETVTPPAGGETPVVTEEPTDEDEQIEDVEVKSSMKREKLNEIALAAGLASVETYSDKDVVVAAIERVRAGEHAADVDAGLKQVIDNGDVEVEVVAPFYDVEVGTDRRAGTKYKTSKERATKLRSAKLVK